MALPNERNQFGEIVETPAATTTVSPEGGAVKIRICRNSGRSRGLALRDPLEPRRREFGASEMTKAPPQQADRPPLSALRSSSSAISLTWTKAARCRFHHGPARSFHWTRRSLRRNLAVLPVVCSRLRFAAPAESSCRNGRDRQAGRACGVSLMWFDAATFAEERADRAPAALHAEDASCAAPLAARELPEISATDAKGVTIW